MYICRYVYMYICIFLSQSGVHVRKVKLSSCVRNHRCACALRLLSEHIDSYIDVGVHAFPGFVFIMELSARM